MEEAAVACDANIEQAVACKGFEHRFHPI
jgi:hypothetical protein